MVQACLVEVAVNDLLTKHIFIVVCDDGNQEVEHDDQHEEGLDDPNDPDEYYIEVLEDALFFLEDLAVHWHTKLTNRCSESLQNNLSEQVESFCFVDLLINLHL